MLSSLKEPRFLSLDTEDENALTEMGKADGPAQQTNLGKRSVMVGLGLMSEGEGNRKNTTILSDGE